MSLNKPSNNVRIAYSKSFIKQAQKLNPKLRAELLRRINLFQHNPLDPKLRNHPLKGKYKIYRSINISGDVRALYVQQGNEVIFETVGTHSQLYG